jgi:hypothetical protein
MMTGLGIVLGASLVLFIGTLVYAVVQDWKNNRRILQQLVAEQAARSGLPDPMQRNFRRAARRPARVLGSYLL